MKNEPAGRVAAAIATWFGCGYSPVAPGTAGSGGALLPAVLLSQYAGFAPWHFALLAAAITPAAVWAAGRMERACGKEDPSIVVVDEVAGQWLTLAGAAALNWKTFLAAFALFRLFDIWKPFPVRRLEALPAGIGTLADDLGAGLYGALVLFAAGWFNFY